VKRYRGYAGALCLAAVVAAAEEGTAVEQEQTTSPSREYIGGEIVVTAERTRPVEQAGTTRTLDAEDLERRGARNLSDALGTMSGIYTRIGNDGVERIDIRGFRTRHVILLLNGVPLNSTYDAQFDASLLPVENIARIKVGYGNQSILYGSGGLGGVINVITKTGEPGLHGSGEVEVGEGGRYIGRATLSQSTEKVDVFVGASHAQQDHYLLSDDFVPTALQDGKERDNSDYERNNVLGSATIHLEDDWALGFVGNYMVGEYGKPPSIYPQNTFASNPRFARMDDYEGFGGQLTLNRSKKDELSVRSALFYNELSENENGYDNNSYSTISANRSYTSQAENRSYGANLQLGRRVWTDAHLTVAGMLKEEQYDEDRTDYGSGGSVTQTRIDRQIESAMLGAELEQQLFEEWVLVGGISGNWQVNDDGDVDAAPSYMIGTTYDLFEPTLLHASYAHQIRFPSIRQLYDAAAGNPSLAKETSENYEAGITQMLGGQTKLDVTGFVRDVDDFIERPNNTTPNQNYEEYLFYGVETTVDSQLADSLNAYAGYTWMQTEDRSPGSGRDELQYRPEHVAQLGAEWTVLKHLILFGNIEYVADQYYYSRTAPLQKAKLNDFTVVNLRATLALWDPLHLHVGVDNVFDENYEESYGFPREGRTFYAGMKATF